MDDVGGYIMLGVGVGAFIGWQLGRLVGLLLADWMNRR